MSASRPRNPGDETPPEIVAAIVAAVRVAEAEPSVAEPETRWKRLARPGGAGRSSWLDRTRMKATGHEG